MKKIKLVTYVENGEQLDKLIAWKDKCEMEIIIGTPSISRYFSNSHEEMIRLLQRARRENLNVVLLWDTLATEDIFMEQCELIDRLPMHEFKAIRIQDPGALEYIKNKYPWQKIQLVLENGNHNLSGLMKWSEYLGDQCERLVLSNEISKVKLLEYARSLSVPLEIMVFGRIPLFYSPRKLLSVMGDKAAGDYVLEAYGTSEESPHSGFPLIENRHGTFMFNVKDLYLLDHLPELVEMGIENLRVDLRFDKSFEKFAEGIIKLFSGDVLESDLSIKKMHPRPLIKGFYNINKTDVLFTKLKNKRIQRLDKNYIGEIVDVERGEALALLVKTDGFNVTSLPEIKMITPEGKEKIVQPAWIKSSLGEGVLSASKNDLVLIPYISGVTVKTQVYYNQ